MKQIFILLTVLLIAAARVDAQELPGGLNQKSRSGGHGHDHKEDEQLDSLGYNSVKSVINVWKLANFGSMHQKIELDTVLGEQQNYNPIYKRSISNSFLGNLGSAYRSNIYRDRVKNENFLFFRNYREYILKPEDILFFNTTTPYTRLSYSTGGSKTQKEDYLRVLHTQNINPFWNFGISYNLISSEGQYQKQKAKPYNFNLFSSYRKRRYGVDFVLNSNRLGYEENGGVNDDKDITDKSEDPENIQVKLSDATSKLASFNFLMNHTYGIGNEKELINEKDTTYAYDIDLIYNASYEIDSWQFRERTINSDFYGGTKGKFNSNSTFDEVEFSNVKNTFQVVFNENKQKWIRLGARFGLVSEFGKYKLRMPVGEYAYLQKDKNIRNNRVLASLFSESGDWINWTAKGEFFFDGRRQGDAKLSYDMTKWLGKKKGGHGFTLRGKLETKTPNFIYDAYNGNHQQWTTDFDRTTELEAEFTYFNEKYKLKIGGQINQIDNHVYFGDDAMPQQTSKGINILTAYLDKNFKFGHFHLNQKLVYQKTSNKDILPLPTFSIYSNNYYKNTFFNGALGLQTGISVHYNTAFNAPAYMPSINQFILQNEKKLGDYPKVDIYFNFRIKRTRFFFKYEHVNASMGSKNYFSSLHYPINPSVFRYGLIWTFYN